MNLRLALGLAAAAAAWGAASCKGADPARFPDAVPLFNGTNLSGWSTWLVDTKREDPRHVFTVTNGWLRISGDGLGYLASDKEYSDYRLLVEYKWGTRNWPWGGRMGKARDSGIFLHSIGPYGNSHDGQGAFRAGIECQLMEGATGDFLLIRGTNSDGSAIEPRVTVSAQAVRDAEGWPFTDLVGTRDTTLQRWGRVNWSGKSRDWKDQFDFRGLRDVEKPAGEWNELAITCQEEYMSVTFNGTLVNEAHRVWPSRGGILLQCEGSEIFFRRVAFVPILRR